MVKINNNLGFLSLPILLIFINLVFIYIFTEFLIFRKERYDPDKIVYKQASKQSFHLSYPEDLYQLEGTMDFYHSRSYDRYKECLEKYDSKNKYKECYEYRKQAFVFSAGESPTTSSDTNFVTDYTDTQKRIWQINSNKTDYIDTYFCKSDSFGDAYVAFSFPNKSGITDEYLKNYKLERIDFVKNTLNTVTKSYYSLLDIKESDKVPIDIDFSSGIKSVEELQRFYTGVHSGYSAVYEDNSFSYSYSSFGKLESSYSCIPKDNLIQTLKDVISNSNKYVVYSNKINMRNDLQGPGSDPDYYEVRYEDGNSVRIFISRYEEYPIFFCKDTNCKEYFKNMYNFKEEPYFIILESKDLKNYINSSFSNVDSSDARCVDGTVN